MDEFDTTPAAIPVPHSLSMALALSAVRVIVGMLKLAMDTWPDELREMRVLDDLAMCYKVLVRVTG